MNKEKLKEIIENKKNPVRAMLRYFTEMKKEVLEVARKMVEQGKKDFEIELGQRTEAIQKEFNQSLKEFENEIKQIERQPLEQILGRVQQLKGDPGKNADEKLIVKKVLDQIPPAEDGKTPTESELLKIIKPLIPKVRDGKDADERRIAREVLDRMPKPKDGDPGEPGADGKEIEPDRVIDKIHSSEKLISRKKIEGFEDMVNRFITEVRRVKQKGGGSGGGMGNPVHDQFDGDGSTTVFTLTYKVAASGTAVFGCRYEGQVLHLGDQYTISGKTLTLTFTPDNGTKIEISYIRT